MSQIDSFLIASFLIALEFIEIATLDRIMRTMNVSGNNTKKSQAAIVSSDEESVAVSSSDDADDDYPSWRLMIKKVEGNQDLYKQTSTQLKINDLERKFKLRTCDSCIEFPTGTDIQEDERMVRSFPTSPREYRHYDGMNPENYGKTFDNVYAEGRPKRGPKEFSEMGS